MAERSGNEYELRVPDRITVQQGATAGQPYCLPASIPHRLSYSALALVAALVASACGSTSVTDLTGPDDTRCAASITVDPATVSADGGSITVSVASERDCTWSARSDANWLQVRSASGQGNGSFTATAARNEQPAARTGAIVVNNQQITITQEARACTITLQGPAQPVPPTGGTATVQVSTVAGCAWTAGSSAPWLVLRADSGSGSGLVPFDVQPNPGPEREASVTVNGQSVVVTQRGLMPACNFSIAPQSREFPASGGQAAVAVTAEPGCAWAVSGGSDWTTLLTPSGTGSGEAQYQVSANPSVSPRQTTITIAGRVHSVTQQGMACTFAVNPGSRNVPAGGGPGTLDVVTQPGCPWTATSNAGWVTLRAAAGTGPGQLLYDVQANPLPAARTAQITAGGQTHTVTQDAVAPVCTYQLDPPSHALGSGATTAVVRVSTQAGCGWSAAVDVNWATVAPGPASGAGTTDITYSVAANDTTSQRTGTLTVGGQSHTFTQAAPCTYTLTPPSVTLAADATTGAVQVNTTAGCTWTAASPDPWITLTPGPAQGSGTATVVYSVGSNDTGAERTGTVVIAGPSSSVTHTVTQPPAVAIASSDSPSFDRRLLDKAADIDSVQVTTASARDWRADSNHRQGQGPGQDQVPGNGPGDTPGQRRWPTKLNLRDQS